VAVVTGAGSGIGRELALQFAAKGCRLALSDINAKALAETAAMLPVPPLTEAFSVADRAAFIAFADRIIRELGTAHIIVNNAGVTVSQTLANLSYEDFEWLLGINFWGVVHGTKAFLPWFLQQNEGVIVNISSIYGLIAWPSQGAYTVSKFAVRGFTECLRIELGDSKVRAIQVHPGGVKTNIVRNARFYVSATGENSTKMVEKFDSVALTTPQQAAAKIINAIERERSRVVIGIDAKIMSLIQRLAPSGYISILKSIVKRANKAA
jgi:NAD(P)-dependent dehydrogenase (short-subunit alcohol dehydrogenase family)